MLLIQVGLVGTGYVAKLRADCLQADDRAHIASVTGHNPEKVEAFSQAYGAKSVADWQDLVAQPELDLVIIAAVNRDHGAIAHAALEAGKHVVVEYPLSLDVAEAEMLLQLAKAKGKMLHIEHIELLSGIHRAVKAALPAIATPFYVRYNSLAPQSPAPLKWTYQPDLFGFPFIGALSRISRLTNLFGQVTAVSGQSRFWDGAEGFYRTCVCTAQLRFASGLIADTVYGKGEAIWKADRTLEIRGEAGAIVIEGDQGTLIQTNQATPLEMGSRRGLFVQDMTMVLDHLTTGAPLYVTPEDSVYALKVADAVRRASESGEAIAV
ncbi:MAG: Gfo/Idh/MocA family oxidoreductase [Leptolyngbyaceae cyanobacterium CSU_1_4]|nr:Gfo/Idh/MocA family oxidoreductase [Leptolyngbyaceae cyanobacterium CSU_1_4]